MGSAASANANVDPNSKCKEYSMNLLEVFDIVDFMRWLDLSWHDVDRIHASYNILDLDKDRRIRIDEFVEFLGEEKSDFAADVFRIFDRDGDNNMTFLEYLGAVVKVCSSDHDMLCRFAFRMIDTDNSGTLEVRELKELVHAVYGKEVHQGGMGASTIRKRSNHVIDSIQTILERMGLDSSDGLMGIDDFCACTHEFPMLMEPAFRFQNKLKKKIIGKWFWEKRSEGLRERFNGRYLKRSQSGKHSKGDWWGHYVDKFDGDIEGSRKKKKASKAFTATELRKFNKKGANMKVKIAEVPTDNCYKEGRRLQEEPRV